MKYGNVIVSGITNAFGNVPIPWGKITLYDSISRESIDFPVYPEAISASRSASYGTMQDMLYQIKISTTRIINSFMF